MTKNITVVDEQGNEYEATYPKRAKGLVKCGRARFVDENTICLACPPDKFKAEDIKMSENKNIENVQITEVAEVHESKLFNMEYVLEQIAKVQEQLCDLRTPIGNIGSVADYSAESEESGDCYPNSDIALPKIEAIKEVFCMREENLMKLLAIYEKMLDTLIAIETGANTTRWSCVQSILEDLQRDDISAEARQSSLGALAVLSNESDDE